MKQVIIFIALTLLAWIRLVRAGEWIKLWLWNKRPGWLYLCSPPSLDWPDFTSYYEEL